MIFGAVGMSASMVVLAATSKYSDVNKSAGIVAAIFLFVFNSFFAVGWLGMTWLYPAEVTPLAIRAPANAISTTANWIFNVSLEWLVRRIPWDSLIDVMQFLVVMVTPPAFANIGYQTYIIFAVINAFMVPCVYFFYPETAYRSLEEMDEIFQECHGFKGAFDVVKVAKAKPQRYDKHGALLINYEETDYAHRRHSKSTGVDGPKDFRGEKSDDTNGSEERQEHV